MALEAIIARYGLLGIFLGAGVEGEAVVITGGVIAHRGLLPLWGVMVAAAIGSFLVDQLWFLCGRLFRHRRWVKRLMAKPAFARAQDFLEKRPVAFILAFRFIYGMRTASPIAIGISRIPTRLFVPLNAIAAAVWAPLIAALGYGFGGVVEAWMGRARSAVGVMLAAAAVLLLLVLAFHAGRRWFGNRAGRSA